MKNPSTRHASIRHATARFVSVSLIVTLLVPTMLFGDVRATKAMPQSPANLSLPTAAPPEPFVIPSGQTSVMPTVMLAAVYAGVSDVFVAKAPEPGFEILGTPTFAERLTSFVSPLLAFASPKATDSETAASPPPAGSVEFDFDNDGKADIARWHGATTEFKIRNSGGGTYSTYTTLGTSSSKPAPGDYDGDGATDAGVFNAGTWNIRKSSNGASLTIILGGSGDIPAVGDYDGDTISDAALFRPSDATWYVKRSSDGVTASTQFGLSTDIPVAGNYDTDGKTDIAVFRPSTGTWYVQASLTGLSITAWGLSTDIPVPADYDGDNKTDLAVYRGSTGVWWVLKSGGGSLNQSWGNYGDQPVPADYDGDNKADFSVWRPTTGVWHTLKSNGVPPVYEYHTLGVPGDFAVSSAYIKQIGSTVSGYSLAKARLAPTNATGGTDLYSRNFAWGTALVGLPGRAGLDAGFGIGYNSLVWTRDGSSIYFDTNNDNISPGFRFGFPTIEPAYYDSTTSKWNYLMVTPSGARTEFRQTTVSNVYETADSSYAQLVTTGATNPNDPVEDIKLTVTTTDGTRTSYEWKAGAFRCKEIKDRNGNYITVNHDDQGLLRTVTDTLGRVVTVNYDTQLYPISITQTWKTDNGAGSNTTHTWASFSYTTKEIDTNFALSAVIGPPDGTVLRVLERVTYADGSSTRFTHNGYAQVYKIANHAPDGSFLNHVRTNLETVTGAQTDCPRLAQTKTKVANFNNDAETVVDNTLATGHSVADIDGGSVPATLIQVSMQNHPTGNVTNTYVHPSGWREGLPIRTDDYSNETGFQLRRSNWTKWTQDDPNAGYVLNPRVTESKVSDGVNTKRATTDYYLQSGSTTASLYGLVSEVKVYDANQTSILKRLVSMYNLDNAYVSRRIIGLPASSELYDGNNTLQAKRTYAFDEGDFSDSTLNQNISPIQHDNSNYGSGFIVGRANLTSTTRWDVLGESSNVAFNVKYNTAGSAVAQISPWTQTTTRTVKISYGDSFSDGINNRNTFAYPTRLTDPAGFYSEVKYRHDIGANVWAKSPDLNSTTVGKETFRTFDAVGRLLRETVANSGAYTRYEYFDTGLKLKVYSTITDNNGNGADAADEVATETVFDGAGRTLKSRTAHPGSTGGYSGTKVEYDLIGRAWRSTVPTEMDENWNRAGDDASGADWLWKLQEYDWMSRVTRQINTDGSDVLISYDGCGCAGGLVTTIQGELVPRDDQPTVNGRRTQKVYADILGRDYKTELLNWDGGIYATNVSTFNCRDQVIKVREHKGSSSNPRYQTTSFAYDGHGRLKSQHVPKQDPGTSTTFSYHPDDRLQTKTDARGATSTYTYNSRGLVDRVDYSLPAAGGESVGQISPCSPSDPDCEYPEPTPTPMPTPSPTPTPNPTPTPAPTPLQTAVTFAYDDAGNRTNMTDPMGGTVYQYTSLSQLMSETRSFPTTLPQAPAGGFRIQYTYGLSGQLKSITDPYNQVINYGYDPAGRLTSVAGGAAYAGITNYAANAQYRAWGGLKHLENGNGMRTDTTFNNRLQPLTHSLKNAQNQYIMQKTYSYNADGKLRYMQDHQNAKFDRLNIYDHLGRIKQAKTGLEARGGTVSTYEQQKLELPYRQSYQFNEHDNMTQRNNLHWGTEYWYGQNNNLTYSYYNDRIMNHYFRYDADGRMLQSAWPDDFTRSKYDARGLLTEQYASSADAFSQSVTERYYDGDGREVKRGGRDWVENPNPPPYGGSWVERNPTYYIRSTVLGGEVVSEVDHLGKRSKGFVRAAGSLVATQTGDPANAQYQYVYFEHWDAGGVSTRSSMQGGAVVYGEGYDAAPGELDPVGGNAGLENPYVEIVIQPPPGPENPTFFPLDGGDMMIVNGQRVPCMLDGFSIGCGQARSMMENGSAIPAALAHLQMLPGFRFNSYGLGIFSVTWNVPGYRFETGDGTNPDGTGDGDITVGSEGSHPNQSITRYFTVSWSPPLPDNTLRIAGIDGDRKDTLLKTLQELVKNKDCAQAFAEAGATPIATQVNEGLTIFNSELATNPNNDTLWGDKNLGSQIRDKAPLSLITAADVTPEGPYNGRFYIALSPLAFKEVHDHFVISLIHSFLHSGGKKGSNDPIRTGRVLEGSPGRTFSEHPIVPIHDLEWLGSKYNNVLEKCAPGVTSKAPPARPL